MTSLSILFPAVVALAFSSAPSKQCQFDKDCVMVRYTYCNQLEAIASDQDAMFAEWEKKDAEKARAEKRMCTQEIKPDPRTVEPFCGAKHTCEIRPKEQKEEAPLPPPVKSPKASAKKASKAK